jgi:sulfite exporter TauE/SafE
MENKRFWNGLMLGFAIGTIIWTLTYSVLLNRIGEIHNQELIYVIENCNE